MNFSIFILGFIITICEWEALDYFQMKRHCKKIKEFVKNVFVLVVQEKNILMNISC